MSGMAANLCPFRAFFKFWKELKTAGGLIQVNKVDGPFL
jgi:hypothetical protein